MGVKFKKGQSGNPRGRPRILDKEVQSEIDKNRSLVKELIVRLLSLTPLQLQERQRNPNAPSVEQAIISAIDKATVDGDFIKLKAIMEVPFGRLPEPEKEFEVSDEEKELIIEFRERLREQRAIRDSSEDNKPKD